VEPYQPGKPIDEVKRELGLKNVIKLASNETPYGPSPKVRQAIVKAVSQINRYPDSGCFYLRQALAKRHHVAPEQLIFGNGSDEIIVLALRAFVEEGDEVIIAKPSFLIYEIGAKIVGATIRSVPLNNFHYDLEGMAKEVTDRTKIVFIGNPDNPAGTYIPQDRLIKFLESIRRDIVVFVDQAYFEYVLAKDYPDGIDLLKTYPNVITARTFSKMYGLAGLRIGYAAASAEIIDILNRLREPFNINSLAQAAALACLKDQGYYRRAAKNIEKQRRYIYTEVRKLGLQIKESVTNFILIDVGKKSQLVSNALLKQGVIVRDMSFWGLNSFIRVTIGTEKENRMFVKALSSVIKENI
jgi:histidinol-phosphate aminotransferase